MRVLHFDLKKSEDRLIQMNDRITTLQKEMEILNQNKVLSEA
jgi:hypothetical protein